MDLLAITTLCISLSLMLLAPCASLQIQIQVQSSQEQANAVQLPLSMQLPRKLRFTEEVDGKGHGVHQDGATFNNLNAESSSGKPYHEKREQQVAVIHGNKATSTWHEWMKGTDSSQFFTMDYSRVRRRRPIHNKAVPVGP